MKGPGSRWVLAGLFAAALVGCKQKAAQPAAGSAVASASQPAPKAAPVAPASGAFEGEIQVAVYAPEVKAPATIDYEVKGDRLRSGPEKAGAGEAHVVSDMQQHRAYAVVDATKSYATMKVDAKAPESTITRTGKIEHVLGRACEDWVIDDAGERVDVCAAKGIAYFDPEGGARGGAEPAWAEALTREHAFPLRITATTKAGKQAFRAEATRIDERRLDDALFKVPSDYRLTPMSRSVKVASIP